MAQITSERFEAVRARVYESQHQLRLQIAMQTEAMDLPSALPPVDLLAPLESDLYDSIRQVCKQTTLRFYNRLHSSITNACMYKSNVGPSSSLHPGQPIPHPLAENCGAVIEFLPQLPSRLPSALGSLNKSMYQ